jgi:thiol:disulfide interchange protein DsbD
MKRIKYILLSIATLLCIAPSFAQMTEDPTTWKYEIKKKSANEYQLIYHLDLKPGWHIWSLTPGGDGLEIVPSFTYDPGQKFMARGKVSEKGKATTTTMEGIDGKVTYLSGKVDYIQDIAVNGCTKITGKHTYQVCNDRMCLPPKDKEFVFEIK